MGRKIVTGTESSDSADGISDGCQMHGFCFTRFSIFIRRRADSNRTSRCGFRSHHQRSLHTCSSYTLQGLKSFAVPGTQIEYGTRSAKILGSLP